jgi:hypothetical protein
MCLVREQQTSYRRRANTFPTESASHLSSIALATEEARRAPRRLARDDLQFLLGNLKLDRGEAGYIAVQL